MNQRHVAKRVRTAFALIGCALVAGSAASALAQFTAGNIVVSQYGDGVATSGNVPITLREFTTSGTATGFGVALPTQDDGANKPIVSSISNTGVGFLKRSVDGRYLSLAGSGTVASTITIARIGVAGDVNSTTHFSVAGGGGPTPRAAITTDGTDFWWSAATGSDPTAGVRFLNLGDTNTGVALAQGTGGSATTPGGPNPVPLNARVIGIFGGQLYGSAAVAVGGGASAYSFRGVYNVGTGTPTLANQFGSVIVGGGASNSGIIDSPWEFFIADANTIYVADDDTTAPVTGGLQKWIRTEGAWSKAWTIIPDGATGMRGLTGLVAGDSVQLYGITSVATSTGANSLVALSDTLTGMVAPSFTTLATADTNYVFRGVALAPVPEPSAIVLGLAGLAAMGGIVRWRARSRR